MKQKIYLIALFMTTLSSCVNALNKGDYASFKKQQEKDYARLDSLERSYTSKPAYFVQISSYGCLYEVLINDVYTDRITDMLNTEKAVIPINSRILQSDKQRVKVILKPYKGWKAIVDNNPFKIRIGYQDFKEYERNPASEDVWHWVWESPEVTVPEEGLPYFEIEADFEAQVPYVMEGWTNCVDLRQIPDIEERVVAEFKRIRELLVNKKMEELEMLLEYKNLDLATGWYETSSEVTKDWQEYSLGIEQSQPDEWQPIEDYELVFYANGRLVTLESKKDIGFKSALLRYREEWTPDDEEYATIDVKILDMRLGMLSGTDKLIPIR